MMCLPETVGLAMAEELMRRQTLEEKTLGYFAVVIYSSPRIAIGPAAVVVAAADMAAAAVGQDILHHNHRQAV